jgi:hypothetical protein
MTIVDTTDIAFVLMDPAGNGAFIQYTRSGLL